MLSRPLPVSRSLADWHVRTVESERECSVRAYMDGRMSG